MVWVFINRKGGTMNDEKQRIIDELFEGYPKPPGSFTTGTESAL
jgi:hypothetical protein